MSSPVLRSIGRSCVLVAWLVLMFVSAFGQSTGGRILGKVTDSTGAVISGVQVKLVNEATGVSYETTSNESGDYTFVEVAPGNYRVEYVLQGFKKYVRTNLRLDVNQVLAVNATLQPGGAQEMVEVTSQVPLVDTTSTQLGTVVNDRDIAQLPLNERDTYQFLSLQPGVQSQVGADLYYGSNDVGSVSVNGGRGRSNNFSVNGGDANDLFANLPTIQPNPDSVQEFRILTNTFDAEYGRNSGSVVNLVTKAGTNQFHGNVYEFNRNKVMNSKNYLDPEKEPYNRNQFGFTLGGRIKKDRTFFFVAYEGLRRAEGTSSGTVVLPTAAESTGDFSAGPAFTGGITNSFVAQVLDGRNGCDTALGLPANGIALLPTNASGQIPWATVFPSNKIPAACQ